MSVGSLEKNSTNIKKYLLSTCLITWQVLGLRKMVYIISLLRKCVFTYVISFVQKTFTELLLCTISPVRYVRKLCLHLK